MYVSRTRSAATTPTVRAHGPLARACATIIGNDAESSTKLATESDSKAKGEPRWANSKKRWCEVDAGPIRASATAPSTRAAACAGSLTRAAAGADKSPPAKRLEAKSAKFTPVRLPAAGVSDVSIDADGASLLAM